MYARIQCERDLLKIGEIGRFAAKSLTWSIALMRSDSAVTDRRYRRKSLRRHSCRRVIVHNPPTIGGFAKDQREATARLILRAF